MDILAILLIAISLSFDSFAASISTGIAVPHIRFAVAVRYALVLAFFQALMPLVGWFLGLQVRDWVQSIDHWIAFLLLALIGSHMIYEALQPHTNQQTQKPLKLRYNISVAIATSIDALIIGIGLAFLKTQAGAAILIIGGVTFLASMLGLLFGKKLGTRLGSGFEILGGIVLILIGLKILVEHLSTEGFIG